MKGTIDTAQPTARRRTFASEASASGAAQPRGRDPAQRGLVVLRAGVDARTAELRERIAAASRVHVISSLLLRR
jgi:hypothetical protein